MPPYRFSLASLQRLRETHRDQQRGRLAQAMQAEQLLEERMQEVLAEIQQLASYQRDSLKQATFDVNTLLDRQRYELVLQAQLQTMQQQAQSLQQEVARRREQLARAEQQVRVLEKLDEKRQQEFRKSIAKHEAVLLDEIAIQRHFLR